MSVVGGPKISLEGIQSFYMPIDKRCYSGGNILHDVVNPSNVGYLTNSPDFNGTGFVFNSGSVTGQSFQIYTSPTTGLFSLEIVVKRLPGQTFVQQLINTSLYYTGGSSYEVFYNNTNLIYNVNKYNMVANSFSVPFAQNQYAHFYMSFITGIQKIYMNGVLINSGNYFNTGTRPIAKEYSFGSLSHPVGPPPTPANTSSYGTQAEICLIRTYRRELSHQEVINNFNATKGLFGL